MAKSIKIYGIKKKQHGYADYSYVPLVLAAPMVAGFETNRSAAILCRTFAISALGYTLCTNAPWGVLKIIPYKVHAVLDLTSGVVALACLTVPYIRKDKAARNAFLAMGLTGLIIGTLSLIGASKKHAFKIHKIIYP